MAIRIGNVVRTPRWNYDQPKWVIATVSEIVTGYKGTVQYRVEDSEGDSKLDNDGKTLSVLANVIKKYVC